MKTLNTLLITGLLITGLSACENNYYYPEPSPRHHGGYIERGSHGESHYRSTPRVSTTSGYVVDRPASHPRSGYIPRDSY